MSLKVRSGEFGSPEDVKPLPRSASRKNAAEAGKIFAANENGDGIEETKELRPYNREQRGEEALDAALERGRDLRDSAMEKAAPLLASLRSRISSFATRAMSLLKTSFGIGAELKDAAVEGAKYHYEGAADFASTYADMVAPHEELSTETKEEIMQLDFRIQRMRDVISSIKSGPAREGIAEEIEKLEEEKAKLQTTSRKVRPGLVTAAKVAGAVLSSPVTVPMAAGAGLYAGGKMAAEAGGRAYEAGKGYAGEKLNAAGEYAVGKIEKGLDYAEEKETKYLGVGTIASEALSKITGKDIKLTRAQAISLGASIDAAGLAGRFFSGVGEVAGEVLMVDDLVEVAKGNVDALKWAYSMVAEKENREWLTSELQRLNIDAGEALTQVGKEVAGAAWDKTKKGAKVVGKGAAYGAAGVAAVAAAPIVAPVAAVGLAGYGAYKAGEAGVAKARDVWNKNEPEVRARINAAVEGAKADWKRAEPGIIEGIASTVAPAVELAANLYDAPADLKREVTRGATEAKEKVKAGVVELNRIGSEVVTIAERMRAKFNEITEIFTTAKNQISRAMFGEDLMADQPEEVQKVDAALEAMKEVQELPYNTNRSLDGVEESRPRAAKPVVIRQVRGEGAN